MVNVLNIYAVPFGRYYKRGSIEIQALEVSRWRLLSFKVGQIRMTIIRLVNKSLGSYYDPETDVTGL